MIMFSVGVRGRGARGGSRLAVTQQESGRSLHTPPEPFYTQQNTARVHSPRLPGNDGNMNILTRICYKTAAEGELMTVTL